MCVGDQNSSSQILIVTRNYSVELKNGGAGKKEGAPEFVFLAHVVDVISSLHVPFVFRSFSSVPFAVSSCPVILLMWPPAFLVMLAMWACSKTFLVSLYCLRGRQHQVWVVPRFGFQVGFASAISLTTALLAGGRSITHDHQKWGLIGYSTSCPSLPTASTARSSSPS